MKTLEEALAAIEELTTKLSALEVEKTAVLSKNSELISREKAAKTAAEAAAQQAADTAAAAEAAAAEKSGDIEAIKAAAAKKNAALEAKYQSQIADRDAKLGQLLIDNHIKSAIASNNVLPHFAGAVEAMLRSGAKIVDGEAYAADGSALTDATAAFFTSKEAAHFVAAPASSGAGAQGNQMTTTSAWTKPPATGQELIEWARAATADPATYNAMAANWNRPDLQV